MSDDPQSSGDRPHFKVRRNTFNPSIRYGNGSSVWSRRPLPESTQMLTEDSPVTASGRRLLTDEQMFEQAREALMTRMEGSRNEMAQVAAATYIYNQVKGMPVARQITTNIDASSEEETVAVRNRVMDRIKRLEEANEPLTIESSAVEVEASVVEPGTEES